MASKANLTIALFVAVTLLFFTFSTACDCPTPSPKPKPPAPKPVPKPAPKPAPKPKPTPSPTPTSPTCSVDTLKLGVCANVLDLIKANVGKPPVVPCCSLIDGLVDLEAAVCLCTAIKANVLGINLDIPIDLSLILNYCNKSCPSGFTCP